ncbi:MAG: cyclase family protein [Acidobacteria bacterium]|nr:cyclase family protein [Acidobacteriota bacterium]
MTSRRRFLMQAAAFGGVALAVRPGVSPARAAAQSGSAVDYAAMYRERRNWGRWGANDQVGAVNLITAEKRRAAAALVQTGRTVSLSRTFEPPQHFMTKSSLGPGGGYVMDYLGFIYHGVTITHIDALCHIWDDDGMWQGRDPDVEVTTQGAHFGDITHWKEGIITKGVLIDVPRHRGEPHVSIEKPVTGEELEAIAQAENVTVEPGDALLVHSGWGAVALLDNALLEPIAEACAEENRWSFLFQALPLNVAGGTGSPVNPIAMF